MKKYLNNEGITLIEVVASIVILSIILISFATFLPQMGKTNNQNENKQQATNLAQKEFIYWKNILERNQDFQDFLTNPTNGDSYQFIDSNAIVQCNNDKDCSTVSPINTVSITTHSQDSKYSLKIVFNKNSNLNNGPTKAYETIVIIFNDKRENISESYGYIFL